MSEAAKQAVHISDWVSGTSVQDEKFIGFVQSIDAQGVVRVVVTQCDHEEAVGETVESSLHRLEKLAEYVPNEETPLRSLMDVALMTRDQAWFNDLISELHIAQFASHKGYNRPDNNFGSGNGRVKID
ncbi:hypothetical protein [Paenibacillus xerothermodurans]|uniref:IDEAL domain-containing protein n=1 Tax=Paenibacillus xerothermodurans TaxID=1977292 RepID=A0A2W1NZE7_PAEXE|nr:hypothetical protein [Paenibacillus xerothermodurans]PZE20228.1 hypothetical protein CBW46_013835 [Paenibacillus xerothermodurans]